MARRQICFLISESIYEKLVDAREKTGLSLSTIVNITLKGYEIVDTRGSDQKILNRAREIITKQGVES